MSFEGISYFCPVYNEVEGLEPLVRAVDRELARVADRREIIVVDDGSTDGSAALADRLAGEMPSVRVVHNARNLGYGRTLREGFRQARYEIVVYSDADSQYDPADLHTLLPLLAEADIVSGVRVDRKDPVTRRLQSRVYNALIRALFGLRLQDVNSAFKAYRRSALDGLSLRSESCFIDAEVLIRAARRGARIREVRVSHRPRAAGQSSFSGLGAILHTFREAVAFRLGDS